MHSTFFLQLYAQLPLDDFVSVFHIYLFNYLFLVLPIWSLRGALFSYLLLVYRRGSFQLSFVSLHKGLFSNISFWCFRGALFNYFFLVPPRGSFHFFVIPGGSFQLSLFGPSYLVPPRGSFQLSFFDVSEGLLLIISCWSPQGYLSNYLFLVLPRGSFQLSLFGPSDYCAVGHLCVGRFVVAFLVASTRLLRSASSPLVHKSRGLYLHRPS